MDRFQAMQVFVAVVDAGSFVGAADTLGMSRPAVSRHLSELESRLGVRLLQRTTRTLSLTGEGEAFYTRSKSVLADLDEAEAEAQSRSAQASGLIKVSVPTSYGLIRLAPLWGPFLARHPKLRLDLSLSDRFVDLVEEGYDLAVRVAHMPSSTLVSRRLGVTRPVLCASPRYLRKRGTPRQPADLARHDLVSYSLLATGDNWALNGPHGAVNVKVLPRMATNSGDTCRAVALAHGGIILQPDFLVGEDLQEGRLVEVLPAWRAADMGIHAVYPTRKHLSPKVRLLVDYLAEALGGDDADRL